MARTKITHRTYNRVNPQQAENVTSEAETEVEESAEGAPTPPDVAESEDDDLPNAFFKSETSKDQGNPADSRAKEVSDSGSTVTTPKPKENGLDQSLKALENGLDLSPKPQENVLDMSFKSQENVMGISPKPQANVLDSMSPKRQENGLDMYDDTLESVRIPPVLGRDQQTVADIDTHISRDSPLNLAWDSSMKENYQPQPVTPEFIRIPVDELLPPTIQKEITTTIRSLFPNGPPAPPPVRPMRRPKKGDVPYIVGCTKRPRVPSPKSLTVFQGDPYGITDSTNCQEDEEQCSPAKRGRRGPNSSASLSKSRFNPQSNEIAERLKLHEKIDRLLGRTPKEEPVSYMSKPRSFSPLPSTSTDNETIMKNDKHFSESLNSNDFDMDDDDDLPEILWNSNKYKQEKDPKTPLAIVKYLNEDKKTNTDNVIREMNEDMNNNNDIISIDDEFCEIEFDKYMPKEKILDYSDVEVVKPKQNSEVIDTEVVRIDDACNHTSNVNPVSQVPTNTGTSVLRSSNKIATSTETKQSDLVIEVPDVLEPINMSRQASTSRLSVWNEDVQFVSEIRTSERPRAENIENISVIPQDPSTIRMPPELSLQFLLDLSECYAKRKARSQSRKKNKRHKKENQDIAIVNNENAAPSVNQVRPESASQLASTSPGKRLGECPICLENLPAGSIASTNCGHVFCLECIKQSLETTGRTCPTCRKKLRGVGYHQVFL